MKRLIIILSIIISLWSCQTKSDCFGGRNIVDEIQLTVKYVKRQEPIFKDTDGKKYIACNFSDTLIKNQNYNVDLKLLKIDPSEKWIGQPCEISKLEIQKDQNIDFLRINQECLFLGGAGKTDNEESITNGINITRISDLEIVYEFTELINWKIKKQLNGQAIFEGSSNTKIEIRDREYVSAFKFVDLQNNVEIFLTKELFFNESKVRLFEKHDSKISAIMYNK